MLEAHRGFGRFRGTTAAEFLAWLRPVVVRAAGRTLRGHLDAGKRAAGREGSPNALGGAAAPGSSPSAAAVRHEEAAKLAAGLATLPDDMQRVLLGRHADGLDYAALAGELGRSAGAVRVLYTRALRRLRAACDPDPKGQPP